MKYLTFLTCITLLIFSCSKPNEQSSIENSNFDESIKSKIFKVSLSAKYNGNTVTPFFTGCDFFSGDIGGGGPGGGMFKGENASSLINVDNIDIDPEAHFNYVYEGGRTLGIVLTRQQGEQGQILYVNVFIENTVISKWVNATNDAIIAWNTAFANLDKPIRLRRVYSKTITSNTLFLTEISRKSLPSPFQNDNARGLTGQPTASQSFNFGSKIEINSFAENTNIPTDEATSILVHEIGHNFGYGHTDDMGTNITGTPDNDTNSWMNSTLYSGLGWNTQGFTLADLNSINRVFTVLDLNY